MKALSLTVVVLVLALCVPVAPAVAVCSPAANNNCLYTAPIQTECGIQSFKCAAANFHPNHSGLGPHVPISLSLCMNDVAGGPANCLGISFPNVPFGNEVAFTASGLNFPNAVCPEEAYCIIETDTPLHRGKLRGNLCTLDDNPNNPSATNSAVACTDAR